MLTVIARDSIKAYTYGALFVQSSPDELIGNCNARCAS